MSFRGVTARDAPYVGIRRPPLELRGEDYAEVATLTGPGSLDVAQPFPVRITL